MRKKSAPAPTQKAATAPTIKGIEIPDWDPIPAFYGGLRSRLCYTLGGAVQMSTNRPLRRCAVAIGRERLVVVNDSSKRPDARAKTPSQTVVVHESSCPLESWDDALRGNVVWRTLISGDRTPTSQMTMGVAEIGPGETERLSLHRHDAAEIYYVLSGEGVVSIDGTEHPLRAGSSVFIPGNVLHGARNTGRETLRLLYVFATDSFSDVEYVFPS